MHITQQVGISHKMTPAAVNAALAATGYDDNSAVAVIQHENLVLFSDDVNVSYNVADVHFKLVPRQDAITTNGGRLNIVSEIHAEYGDCMITYNAESAYNDTTDPYPDDLMAPIKISDLGHPDAFYIALMQAQPDLMEDDPYSIFGVDLEGKRVLIQFENRFYEYNFKVVPDEEGIHGSIAIEGLPFRVWDKA